MSLELETSTTGTGWGPDPSLQIIEDTPTRLVARRPIPGAGTPWLARLRASLP